MTDPGPAADPVPAGGAQEIAQDGGGYSGSPLLVGFAAAVGVGIAYLLFRTVVDARDVLILVALALFFAAGMDPAVRAVRRWGLPRPLAVAVVFLVLAGVATGFGFAVVPPLVNQVTSFVHRLPGYLTDLEHNKRVARLDSRFHVIAKARTYVQSGDLVKTLGSRVLSAGTALATTVFDGVTVLILSLYFMAYLDHITGFAGRLVPRSRRARAGEVGTKIMRQVGEFVAGNLVLGLVAGIATVIWLSAIGAPFPIALAFVVALLDVVPLVGAAAAGVIVSVIVLISSTAGGIATIVFLVCYQLIENYVVVPRVFRTRVAINPAATILGALTGAALLGVIGFLIAIPVVATLDLLMREVVIPRQRRR